MKNLQKNLHFRFLSIVVVLAGAVFAVRPAFAVVPAIELLNPTPSSIVYQGTSVNYEVQVTNGTGGDTFAVEWQFIWDGTTELFTPDFTGPNFVIPSFVTPAIAPLFPQLRTQHALDSSLTGVKQFRVRVTDRTTGELVIASGKFFVLNSLAFTGYTWTGASTSICIGGSNDGNPGCSTDTDCPGGKCGNDALGWTSYSCANNGTQQCTLTPGYSVRVGLPLSAAPIATLMDSAWIGDPQGNTPSTGWLMYNKSYCSAGSRSGLFCNATYTCPGGACVELGTLPAGVADPENWANPAIAERSYVYSGLTQYGGIFRYPSQVSGWARLLSIRDYGKSLDVGNEWGWVHLRGGEAPKSSCVNGPNNGKECTVAGDCPGGTCTPDTNGYTNVTANGYHNCSDCSSNKGKCNICQKIQLQPGDLPAQYTLRSCNSCYGCDTSGNCNRCEKCDTYGVSYDSQQGKLVGFAWGGNANEDGIGWSQFDPTKGGIGVLQAWLSTRYGDIFVNKKDPISGKSIITTTPLPHPPGTNNATYLIQANGTIDFTSQAGYLQPGYPSDIKLPSASNQYINVLGRIDFATITQPGKHRYGETVQINTSDLDTYINTTLQGKLGGKIYYYNGNATIDQPVVLQPGQVGTESGAGTIIIDGDLTITSTVSYNTDSFISNIANLPSIAWLVRGNLNIDPTLGSAGMRCDSGTNRYNSCSTDLDCPPSGECGYLPDLVGAFLVVGYVSQSGNTVACSGKAADDPEIVGGGVVSTGDTSSLTLVVNGLMMARCFNFQRNAVSQLGSEQVVYDGRLIANPPAGLQNLTAVLPVIREVTP